VRTEGGSRGFTLVEILLVVALVGLIATSALGPMIFLVEKLRAVRDDYGGERKVFAALESVVQDLRDGLPQSSAPFRLVRRDALAGGPDDALLVWSLGPTRRGGILGTVVYAVVRQDLLHPVATGLYRWDLKVKAPAEVSLEGLKTEDARLVLPGADSFRVEARQKKAWVQEAAGKLPQGVRITVTRWGRSYRHQDWLPVPEETKP